MVAEEDLQLAPALGPAKNTDRVQELPILTVGYLKSLK